MAGQADGSIIIDTELSSDGFKAGSSELLAAIKALSEEVKKLGATLTELFKKPLTPEVNTSSAEDQIAALEAQVHELEIAMEEMRNAASSGQTAAPEVNMGGTTQKASDLQRQIDSVNSSVERLEPTFQKAMSGSASSMTSFEGKASALESKIAELQQRLEAVGQAKFPTQEYQEISAETEKAGQKLESLLNKQEKMQSLGVKETSAQWKNLQYDLDMVAQKYDRLEAIKARMESSGTAFQLGVDTTQYAQMEATLSAAAARLEEMRSGASQSEGHMSRLSNFARSVASHIGRAAKSAAGALVQGIKSAASHMAKMVFHGKKMNSQFGGLISGAKKFALSLLGARGVYALLRKAVSAYMAENQQLSNTLSACWSGIGNLLGPIITKLINLVAQAVAYVTAFLKLFGIFGKSTTKAISSAGGAASSAAKDLKRQLASFDELNILSDNSSDSGGGGGAGDMGAELPDVTLPDWAKLMVEQIKAGDWAAAATTLATQLNNMIAGVDWAGIGQKIGYYLNGALTFLATFIQQFDWKALGSDLATCLNGVITGVDWGNLAVILSAKLLILLQALTGFFETLDGAAFGNAIHQFISGGINSVDWVGATGRLSKAISDFITAIDFGQIGTDLSDAFKTVLESIGSAIESFDWGGLGSQIAGFINGIDWGGIIADCVTLIGDVVDSALDLLIDFVEKTDWSKLGNDLWTGLESIVTNINWGGLVSKAFELLGAAIGGATQLVWTILQNLWELLCQGWDATKSYFTQHIENAGGDVIQGLWNGIVAALANVGNWIIENIWNPFIEGFKSAFGIHSPSTKMAEQGNFIVQGLLQGITEAWHAIVEFFSEALDSIIETVTEAWESIKSFTSETWEGIKSGVSDAWGSIKSTASNTWNSLKTTVSDGWNNIKTATSSTWSNVKSSLSSTWSGIKSSASSTWSNLKTAVSNGWSNIKSNTSSAWSSVKSSLSSTWSGIKSTASSTWSSMKSTASGAWSSMKSTATSTWSNIKSSLSSTWGSVKSTASSTWSSMKSTLSSSWSSIKSTTSSTWSSIKSSLSSTWSSIKSTASSTWSGIKSTIQNQGWSGVGSGITSGIKSGISNGWSTLTSWVSQKARSLLSAAKSALGIHSPSRLFRDEVGLNIGLGIGEGVEDSEPSVLKSVTSVADAIAAEVNDGSYTLKDIVPVTEVNGAITNFTDKITDGFSSMLDRLQAIAESVTFTAPAVATGAVPYKTAATVAGSTSSDIGTTIEASNDELANVVTQVVTNATTAIVSAIQNYSGTTVNLDKNSLAEAVIKEINRRTRMAGKSPLVD